VTKDVDVNDDISQSMGMRDSAGRYATCAEMDRRAALRRASTSTPDFSPTPQFSSASELQGNIRFQLSDKVFTDELA